MTNMEMSVAAVERVYSSQIKVYAIGKDNRNHQNYQQTAEAVQAAKKIREEEQPQTQTTETADMEVILRDKYAGMYHPETMADAGSTLQQREDQIRIQKSMQFSKARSRQAMAAYGANFGY